MKVFVVGSLNMDLVISAGTMPQLGETVHGRDFMTNPGGKGANQAAALAKLGAETYMVGAVGAAFGTQLLQTLQGYGVHTEHIRMHEDVSSGIAVIVVTDGDNRIILDKGANARVCPEQVDRALELAEPGDYLVLQLEIPTEVVEYALCKARKKGMVTVLNPAPAAELPRSVWQNCDYVIPNQTEAAFYTGIYPADEAAAGQCAEVFAAMGVKNVVITMGEAGSAAVCNGEFHRVKAEKVCAVDSTAAGDTYVGGLVARLAEGAAVPEAMTFAGKAAAISVTRKGAQQSIPRREEVL